MNSDFSDLLRALNDAKAEYLIVGGYAVGRYTEPRYTKDIDIWINNTRENAERVFSALRAFGAPLGDVTVEDLTVPDLVYQVGLEPMRVDIIMGLTGLNFDDCWLRREDTEIDGLVLKFISAEDLIRNKELSGRPQDLIDVSRLRKEG
jgi:predicted nucleotidyltransferase